jgi:hypothetical protein
LAIWKESIEVKRDQVSSHLHSLLNGDEVISENQLRFRTEKELADTWDASGFSFNSV